MSLDQLSSLAILLVGSFSAALLALCGIAWMSTRSEEKRAISLDALDDEPVFLFDDETLVNANESATNMLSAAVDVGSDWSRLLSVLITRFPTIQADISQLAEQGKLVVESRDGAAILQCEWRNGLSRLSLIDQDVAHAPMQLDRHALEAMEQELETLRATAEQMPFAVWRQSPDGTVSWANAAYISLADTLDTEDTVNSWPPKPLFDAHMLAETRDGELRRLSFTDTRQNRHWFDVTRMQSGGECLYAAASADTAVGAEERLREFTQTLTKTFSHLTIGLAVFNKSRDLALFNPALTDLTALPTEFLISRPSLSDFLDRLRDKQMMPEPKDYKSWRQQISALETAAADGTYEELWALPGGITYRVSGRPHPDGAIAFLFEDISAEMSLTRRFRAEIETGQAVIDSLPEAIAVFSSEGVMIMANSAYASLWGSDPFESLAETSITEATRMWHSKCAPTPIWGDIREFVGHLGDRAEWTGSSRLWDGRRLNCRFVPLAAGQTLVGFTPENFARSERPVPSPQADRSFVEI